jgi:hypothetical protein
VDTLQHIYNVNRDGEGRMEIPSAQWYTILIATMKISHAD